MLHYGHIRLLERAKSLGDYLIVGVTSDDFDVSRGKINVQQSLAERISAVRETGIADEIIVEEYEGQKIDDIKAYGINIFTVGSDWKGKFDYLNAFCKVVYLDRTEGISSSEIRTRENSVRFGFIGDVSQVEFAKYYEEASFVNGAEIIGVYVGKHDHNYEDDLKNNTLNSANKYPDQYSNDSCLSLNQYWEAKTNNNRISSYPDVKSLLDQCDAVYIASYPKLRYWLVRQALMQGKHVLCKSPIAMNSTQCQELFELAKEHNVVLMEAIKTAYSTAYNRLLLLAQSGRIGTVRAIDVTCTSLSNNKELEENGEIWNSIDTWGPTAMLPVFQLLGTDYRDIRFISCKDKRSPELDAYTAIQLVYKSATASIKVGKGIKSEGNLIISGTKGYIYVPSPWWKTDYFEIRYENSADNRRYFYHLEGEGIRFELVAFLKNIHGSVHHTHIEEPVSKCISDTIDRYYNGINTVYLD